MKKKDDLAATHPMRTEAIGGAAKAMRGRSKDLLVTPKVVDAPEAIAPFAATDRVTIRRGGTPNGKVVVYWMQRAQRAVDNPALDCAVDVANTLGLPVVVYFAGISNFPHANLRHYIFLNEGLRDVAADLKERNITFVLRNAPREDHLKLFHDVDAAIVIGDENPMRVPESWRKHIADNLQVPFWTVDADVIVPTTFFGKSPYAAYTVRKRLWKAVPGYLEASKNPHAEHAWQKPKGFIEDDPSDDMTAGWKDLDRSVGAAPDLRGGLHAAQARLERFISQLLPNYGTHRNKPNEDATSKLSPYLHYGHISPATITLAVEAAVMKQPALRENADSFLDELVTWRELCIAWVKYDAEYDTPSTAEAWAQTTVAKHAEDKREIVYTLEQLDKAETYDELWNAAQRQMVRTGWMHNFMRMYWAKKVLEWTPDNATAMQYLIHLNDRYFLDGRDPAGYAGIAWAVYGKFDRPWGERKIFGKLRYMSQASTGRKFDSKSYIAQNLSAK